MDFLGQKVLKLLKNGFIFSPLFRFTILNFVTIRGLLPLGAPSGERASLKVALEFQPPFEKILAMQMALGVYSNIKNKT